MILSKSNIYPVQVTAPDKNIPVLDCLHIEGDGSTVGGNGKSFLAVGPVPQAMQDIISNVFERHNGGTVNITSDTAKEVLRSISRDTKYGGKLEHTSITVDDSRIKFDVFDGVRKRKIEGRTHPLSYADYKSLFKRVQKEKQSVKCVLNIKRLLPLLKSLVDASNDTSDFSPVYIEFTTDNDVLLRMRNPKTDQRCVGIMKSYDGADAEWLDLSEWEKGLFYGVDVSGNSGSSSLVSSQGRKMVKKKARKRRHEGSIIDEMCPCGDYHLASDGVHKWCSGVKGCGYVKKD